MYNDVIRAQLEDCIEHILTIENYTSTISNADEFLKQGLLYDASLMRLQALGEIIKRLEQKSPEVIKDLNYPFVNEVIKFRDFVSHHYEKLEHDLVYDICKVFLPELKNCISTLLRK